MRPSGSDGAMAGIEEPLVSIVTPSFNQAQFLRATLASVAAQTYPRIEHIVVDGGSTDGSVEILQSWAEAHPITWTSGPDRGQADAIQQGIERANGQVVAWLNSDDVYLDDSVVRDVVRLFETGARIVSGGGWFVSERGDRLKRIPVAPGNLSHDTLRYVDWVLQPATFVQRELLRQCPLDTELQYAFDWDLFIRLTAIAPITPLTRELAGYRVHPAAKTVSGGARRQRELLAVIRRYHGRRSRAYLLLAPIVAAHRLAARLPFAIGSRISYLLGKVTMASLHVANGRGVQP